MRLTNEENYSLSVAVWLASDSYQHAPVKGPYFSATGLLKPIRMIVLDKRVKALQMDSGDDVMDISRNVPSRLGTAIHSGIEEAWKGNYKTALHALGYLPETINRIKVNPDPNEILKSDIPVYMEKRAYKKVGSYTVGGMFDFVGNGILEDFKSMGVYGYMRGDKDEEHILQGSIYRWLNPEIITSNHMLIQQIFTDWSKLQASIRKKSGYPQQRILTKKLELMPLQETDKWVNERVCLIESLMDSPEQDLPPCTQKELWQDNTVYKYFKDPNKTKRATRNYDSYPEAHTHLIKDGSVGVVQEFHGKVKRCGYCNAFDLCKQKDVYIEQGILQMP